MTLHELSIALPRAAATGRLLVYGESLMAAMGVAQINTPLRCAHFLAQVAHESGELQWPEELATGAAYEGRADLGNTQPGDGRKFKGRGFIQLTGRSNYAAYGRDIRRDLIADPWAVSREPALCCGVATWYWGRHNLNALADHDDCETITRRINGGLTGLPDRLARLEKIQTALIGIEA